jgi:hypothetical protein
VWCDGRMAIACAHRWVHLAVSKRSRRFWGDSLSPRGFDVSVVRVRERDRVTTDLVWLVLKHSPPVH